MCGINKYEFVHVWPTQYNGYVRKAQKSVIKMCYKLLTQFTVVCIQRMSIW